MHKKYSHWSPDELILLRKSKNLAAAVKVLHWRPESSIQKKALAVGIGARGKILKKGRPIRERFFALVKKTGSCWRWIGFHEPKDGYGIFQFNRIPTRAHRVSYQLRFGAIPKGRYVLHRCDVRDCVRPSHLFLGDAADNIRDASRKGRLLCGEDHPRAKLTGKEVLRIRAMFSTGKFSRNFLGRKFSVTGTTIGRITQGLQWHRLRRAI